MSFLICPECSSSKTLVKHGKRTLKSLSIKKQIFMCRQCSKSFIIDDNFKKMRHSSDIVIKALQLHSLNYSLRQIARHLRFNYNVRVCPATIYKWIKKKNFEGLANYLYGKL